MNAVAGARCGTHPDLPAVEVCARCGTFLCGDCVDYFEQTQPHCARCLALVTERPSGRARLSLALSSVGALGMIVGLLVRGSTGLWVWAGAIPTGFVGLAIALQELREIGRGGAAVAGKRTALVARAVGIVHTLLVLALAVAFLNFLRKA